MNGYDAFSKDESPDEYLKRCRNRSDYSEGNWFVFVDGKNKIVSSMVLYFIETGTPIKACGLATIATNPQFRGRGFASLFIPKMIKLWRSMVSTDLFFLYSDIEPDFYKKLKFKTAGDSFQKYLPSVFMVYDDKNLWDFEKNIPEIIIPEYF